MLAKEEWLSVMKILKSEIHLFRYSAIPLFRYSLFRVLQAPIAVLFVIK